MGALSEKGRRAEEVLKDPANQGKSQNELARLAGVDKGTVVLAKKRLARAAGEPWKVEDYRDDEEAAEGQSEAAAWQGKVQEWSERLSQLADLAEKASEDPVWLATVSSRLRGVWGELTTGIQQALSVRDRLHQEGYSLSTDDDGELVISPTLRTADAYLMAGISEDPAAEAALTGLAREEENRQQSKAG